MEPCHKAQIISKWAHWTQITSTVPRYLWAFVTTQYRQDINRWLFDCSFVYLAKFYYLLVFPMLSPPEASSRALKRISDCVNVLSSWTAATVDKSHNRTHTRTKPKKCGPPPTGATGNHNEWGLIKRADEGERSPETAADGPSVTAAHVWLAAV